MSGVVHSFSGSFAGIPASVAIDSSSSTSMVSTSFVLSHNVPRKLNMDNGVSSISSSGPLVLLTSGGWYRSTWALPVQYMRTYDILLGSDWIEACGLRLQGSAVLDHQCGFTLPTWCAWERSPLADLSHRSSDSSADADAYTPPGPSPCGQTFAVPATTQVASADDRSEPSSSRGLGSSSVAGSSRGPAHDMMSSTCNGASIILARTGLFNPDTTRTTLVSAALAHGLQPEDDSADMQKKLLHHLLSGHCARDDGDQLMHGCIRVTGSHVGVDAVGDMIRSDLVRTIHEYPSVVAGACVNICHLLDIPLSQASVDGYDHLFLDDLCEYLLVYNPLPSVPFASNHGKDVVDVLQSLEYHSLPTLRALARAHGIMVTADSCRESLRVLLSTHIAQGRCASSVGAEAGHACLALRSSIPSSPVGDDGMRGLQIDLLTMLSTRLHAKALKRTLTVHGVAFNESSSRGQLRRVLKAHISTLRKGKRKDDTIRALQEDIDERARSLREKLDDVRSRWPQRIPENVKEALIQAFRDDTSSAALKTFTCASCAGAHPESEKQCWPLSRLPLDLLHCPPWVLSTVPLSEFPLTVDPDAEDRTIPLLLARDGVICDDGSGFVREALLCDECSRYLAREQLPPLSWANGTYVGPVPPELSDLTFIEEAIVARARAKCWIVHLKEDKDNADTPVLAHHQRGFKGHIVVYPQRPEKLPEVLPLTLEDIMTPICVIFVGSTQPTKKWLEEKAKPLTVRRDRIHRALLWLQKHNPLYRDVHISHEHLNELPEDGLLPYQIQTVEGNAAVESLTARYDRGAPVQPLAEALPTGRNGTGSYTSSVQSNFS